jgi:hypothetical protein
MPRDALSFTITLVLLSGFHSFYLLNTHLASLLQARPRMPFSSSIGFLVFTSCLAATAANEERAAYNHYPITGVQTGANRATGELPARRNILDLQNDEPTW